MLLSCYSVNEAAISLAASYRRQRAEANSCMCTGVRLPLSSCTAYSGKPWEAVLYIFSIFGQLMVPMINYIVSDV